jgi:glutaminase
MDNTAVAALLAQVHQELAEQGGGAVATYIPELARVSPRLWALAATSVAGETTAAGDADAELTLQSVSKPFVYAWALELLGAERVHERVGVEPAGDSFDSAITLEQATRRPHNPMINAGALAVTGLLAEQGLGIDDLLQALGRFAGRPLQVDLPIYLSESATAHRNRAIAYLMRHFGMLRAPVEATLDLYFQQCAVLVSPRDLSAMAATLAAGGRQPKTGEQVVSAENLPKVLAVMATGGLYDESGRFAFEVGLPAKSGVCGAIVAVAPGQLGLAAFSPPLDRRGNSVRGLEALTRISRGLGLHVFAARKTAEPPNQDWLNEAAAEALVEARKAEGGQKAGYAKKLTEADPDALALAITTAEGAEIAAGDTAASFTLQAAANPFTYAAVVEAVGSEAVHAKVGVEPSGNAFHAIVLDAEKQRPQNPLTNAGAITVCSLAPGKGATERLLFLLERFAAAAGRNRLKIDAAMLQAEKQAGDRNRAIACLLKNFGVVDDEEAALDLYFQQCSIEVDIATLARMGATLASGGESPWNGKRVFAAATVRDTLSLMSTCGLHDESGRFAFEVGLPAKSGISGALLAVLPGSLAIAAFSPPVNGCGTSVKGLAAIKHLAASLRRMGAK